MALRHRHVAPNCKSDDIKKANDLNNTNIKGRFFFFKYIGFKIQPEIIIGRLYCSVVQCGECAMSARVLDEQIEVTIVIDRLS